MGRTKKRKTIKKSSNVVNKMFVDNRFVKTTDDFNNFIQELVSDMNLQDGDYEIKEVDQITTVCFRVMINQTIISKSFTIDNDKYFLKLTTINDGVYIYLMVVNPKYRRKGIGRSLLEKLTSLSNKLNIQLYLVPVPLDRDYVDYSILSDLYKSCGFNREKTSRYWKYTPKSVEYKLVG